MPQASIVCDPVSRSCGDRIQLFFARDGAGLISDASYTGEGCSISIASASMLCDAVIGKNLTEICRLGIDVIDMLELEEEDEARGIFDAFAESGAEDMLALWTLRDLGSRIPCALLSWKVLPGLVDKISP